MKALTWSPLDRYRDHGLLLLRVGIGAMFLRHGWPKVTGGPEKWAKLGSAMESFGITVAPTFWGGAAAFTELVGGALLIVGLATRPAAVLLAVTMLVAWWNHVAGGDGFISWSHSAEDGIVFLALILMGAGRFSVDARLMEAGSPDAGGAGR